MSYSVNSHPITIGDKKVGDGHPIYIMCDLGLTNGGDIKRAFELIDIANQIGADAVKFQMIGPDTLLGDKDVTYTYPTLKDGDKTENMYDMFSSLNYSDSEWLKIANYAKSKGLEFICTAHYLGAVPILEKIGVNIHKICTWSMTHKRLLQKIGKTGKPLMLDTGAFTTSSLSATLEWHLQAGGRGSIILHDFHTKDHSQMNFLSIPYIKNRFNCPVGYTPQGRDYDMDFMSVGLGVNILEKRLTVDRSIPKNGHIKALEPDEFNDWFQRIKVLESSLGMPNVLPTSADVEQSKIFFKSLYLKLDVEPGTRLSDNMLEARRPGTGIPASEIDSVIGRVISNKKLSGEMLSWDDLV